MALGTLGLLVIGSIPTTVGVCEAISAQKKQNQAQKETAKFHLTARLPLEGQPPMEAMVVLKDGKLWVDHQSRPVEGHKFTGYYFTYPSEEQHRGLVSTISDDPPMLNWIYGDKDSGTMRYAGRKDTIGHKIGPWGWTADDLWLTLDGDPDCFVAEEDPENKNWSVSILLKKSHRDRGPNKGGNADGHVDQHCVDGASGGGDDQFDYDAGEYEDGEEEEEEEEGGEEAGEEEDGREGGGRRRLIRLRRRMVLGMEQSYVRD